MPWTSRAESDRRVRLTREMVAEGRSAEEIARTLDVSYRSARYYYMHLARTTPDDDLAASRAFLALEQDVPTANPNPTPFKIPAIQGRCPTCKATTPSVAAALSCKKSHSA